ncbi:hypothetical protein LJR164_004577 [Phenylobacterium sp. LjRoot164]|uniref:DUF2231 domain-containing protein n=1 Tax=unclassified Phenylobacterium TaxID=2640670 RepID=UPI003ECF1C66
MAGETEWRPGNWLQALEGGLMRQTYSSEPGRKTALHPLHAMLLAFPLALFTAALATDIAYLRTAELQWSNFSAWLITGALVVGALVLIWALAGLLVFRRAGRARSALYLVAVLVMLGSGLINAFQHSRDGWSAVGATGVTLSSISALAAVIAAWLGYSSLPAGRRA